MDRTDSLIKRSEACLLIKTSAILTLIQLIQDYVSPSLFESYQKMNFILSISCIILVIVLFYINDRQANNTEVVNDQDDRFDETEIILLLRFWIDFCFILMSNLILVLIVKFGFPAELNEIDTRRPPSITDQLLMRPTQKEQFNKIVDDHIKNSGFFFHLIFNLSISFWFISILRILMLFIQLLINAVGTVFNKNRNQ